MSDDRIPTPYVLHQHQYLWAFFICLCSLVYHSLKAFHRLLAKSTAVHRLCAMTGYFLLFYLLVVFSFFEADVHAFSFFQLILKSLDLVLYKHG